MAGQSTTTSNTAPPWALPYWGSYLNGISDLTSKPYTSYSGPRVADFSPEQQQGMQMIAQRATQGNPLNGMITSSLSGMLGNTNGYGNGASGGGGGGGTGGYTGNFKLGKNPLLNSNPYLDDILKRTGADTARDYALGTAAQTDSRAARAGAFGGSAYEEVNRANAASLADRIAGAGTQMRYQDFGDRRNLEENAINRDLQGQIAKAQINAQRSASAGANATSRANAMDNSKLQALQLAMTYGDSGYKDAAQMMGIGGLRQMYSQNLLDSDYQNFNDQQQYPFKMADVFGNAVSRASGGQGQSTSQTNTQTNPWATALGGGLTLASLYSMFGPK